MQNIRLLVISIFFLPLFTSAQTKNMIRVWEPVKPVTNPNSLNATVTPQLSKMTTVYYDGLGRTEQTVIKTGAVTATAGTDLVSTVEYDAMGREVKKYLPYASPATDGLYKVSALTEQGNFFGDPNGILAGQSESYYYSKNEYDIFPLNRATKAMSPGINWVGAGRGVQTKYYTNTWTDDVRKFTLADVSNDWATYTMAGNYYQGELAKLITIDEQGNQTIEFKNKEDKVVLRKVQVSASPENGEGSGYPGWLSTIYIYDELNRLRAVVQPRGTELLIQQDWNFNALGGDILNEQCFRYEYDGRNRMIRKKVPGAAEVYMIYDRWDRVILSQDGNLRQTNTWIFTKYDEFNRPIMTGYHYDPIHIGLAAIIQHVKDNESWLGRYESIDYTKPHGYTTTQTYPYGTSPRALTITYYDNYDWISSSGSGLSGTLNATDINATNFLTTYNTAPDFAEPLQQGPVVRGQITGTKIAALTSLNPTLWIFTVNIYDEKKRVIQTQTVNITGGKDIATTQYNFRNQPVRIASRQEKLGGNDQTHVLCTKLEYDAIGRIYTVKKTINSTLQGGIQVSKPEIQIVKNEYDQLGYIKNKYLGYKKDANGNYTTNPIETLTMDYNVRGWILGMNRNYLANGATGKYFGYELGYDKLNNFAGYNFSSPQYSGNVNGILWKSSGDGVQRKYDMSYDPANRFLKGDFIQHNLDNSWNNLQVNYTVKVGDGSTPSLAYDANGNIQRLQQYGLKVTGSTQIDDMTYSYYSNGSKLSGISEQGTGAADHKLGDFTDKNVGSNDYGYDLNGNLVTDLNKRLNGTAGTNLTSGGAVTYNFLNLPDHIFVKKDDGSARGDITFLYDGVGNTLKKITVDLGTPGKTITTTTLYIGGFAYESRVTSPADPANPDYTDRLLYITHEEGRIRFTPSIGSVAARFDYDYFIKDHLGNVRMILTDQQQQDIYPAATLEGSGSSPGVPNALFTEQAYYTINPGNIADRSEATGITNYQNNNGNPPPNNNPNSSTTALSQKLYKLTANAVLNGGVTGLGFAAKVMSGDRIDIFGKSYYFQNNSGSSNYDVPVLNILDGFIGTPSNVTGGKTSSTELNGVSIITGAIGAFLAHPDRNNGGTSTTPKAYINYILLDENFRMVGGNFSRVGSANVVNDHFLQNINVTTNGYLYVYVSNESPVKVFFDNLQVIHTRGPLVEETHYYPFGLTMAGISSKAANSLENKMRFIGQRFDDDLGLNLYQFKYRSQDPQTGRFIQADPVADKYVYNSIYAYAENKVGLGFDQEGRELEGFKTMFRYAGIDIDYQNRKVQAYANDFAKKMEPVISVTKDVITIAGGVTLLIASGGTAAPILVGLAGSATVAGGTMKLVFDVAGNKEASDQIPTTLSGTAVFLTNGVSEATTGKKIFSDDVKTVVEFSEGVLTFKVTGFDKMSDLEKASTILSGMSLTLDAANPETLKAFQNLFGTSGGGFLPMNGFDNRAKVDNTYVKPPVIPPPPPPKKTNTTTGN